jgi:hypothetical protein
MHFQVFSVLANLKKPHTFVNALGMFDGMQLECHGKPMLPVMYTEWGMPVQLTPAIHMSVFSPQRQFALPMRRHSSWINRLIIFNCVNEMMLIYASAMAYGSFYTPSKHCVKLPAIIDEHVSVIWHK